MAAKLYYTPFLPAFSNNGIPIAQSYLYFYGSGGLVLAPIYSDAALTVPLTNPVQANLAGKYPDIYLNDALSYRVRQTDKNGVPTTDDIDPYLPGFVNNAAATTAAANSATAAATSATTATTQATTATTQAGISTAAAASAGSSVQGLETVNRSLPLNRNLFDTARQTLNFLVIAGDGTVSNFGSALYCATDYIPCDPSATYVTRLPLYGDGTRGRAYYDASKVYISGQTTAVVAGGTFASPANARYMRLSLTANTPAEYAYNYIGTGSTLPSNFREFNLVEGDKATAITASVVRGGLPVKANLYLRRNATAATLLNAANVTSSSAPYFMTGYVPVEKLKGIASNADFVPGSQQYGWAWYDRDLTFINGSAGSVTASTTNTSATLTVTADLLGTGQLTVGTPIAGTGIPVGAYITAAPDAKLGTFTMSAAATATGSVTVTFGGCLSGVAVRPVTGGVYGRISFETTYLNNLVLSDQSPITTDQGFIGWNDVERLLPWSGLSQAMLGDSIMADATGGNGFQYGLENWTRGYGALWGGVSGFKTREILYAGSVRGPNRALVSGDFANIDLTFSNAGTNDFGIYSAGVWTAPRPLGAIGDTGASNTFYGDMYDIYIAKLLTWKPSMRLALATPLPRYDGGATGNPTNNNGVTLQQYADAILAFGARHSIPVIDLFRLSGVNAATQATFYVDGLHPNGTGYTRIVPLVGKWLNSL